MHAKQDIEENVGVLIEEGYGKKHTEKDGIEDQDNPEVQQAIMNGLPSFSQGTKNSNSESESDLHTTQIKPFKTKGDGNCFFHAVFGTLNNSSNQYETEKAQDMREEWHRFLSQFKSLKDSRMPGTLKGHLSGGVFTQLTDESERSDEQVERILKLAKQKNEKPEMDYDRALYGAYLDVIKNQGYFISTEEILILASLADIEICLYIEKNGGERFKQTFPPNPEMINDDYQLDSQVWGNRKQVTIHHKDTHFSHVPSSPLKEITTNSPRKKVSTSPSKGSGKENTPPGEKQQLRVKDKGAKTPVKQKLYTNEPDRVAKGSRGSNASEKDMNCPSKGNPDSGERPLSENFVEILTGENCTNWLNNFVIYDIAEHVFGWGKEGSDVIFGVEDCGVLPKKLNEFKNNKNGILIYIINKNGNHWVTLVAIHDNRQEDIFFYADSFGEEIEKCTVNGLGRGDTDSNTQNKVSYGNKVNQYSVDCNSQNIEENSDDIIFVEETAPLKQDRNDNIQMSLDEFLESKGYSKDSIFSLSLKQQEDSFNCGVFALENAKAIFDAVKGDDCDVDEVKKSLEGVSKDRKSLKRLRKEFASSLNKAVIPNRLQIDKEASELCSTFHANSGKKSHKIGARSRKQVHSADRFYINHSSNNGSHETKNLYMI